MCRAERGSAFRLVRTEPRPLQQFVIRHIYIYIYIYKTKVSYLDVYLTVHRELTIY